MSEQKGCPFCEELPRDRIIFENDLVFALWDGFPAAKDHALIIPRRHVAGWFEASQEEQAAIFQAISHVRQEIDQTNRPDGYNIGINVGAAAGQTIFHLHVHVIPRYIGDVPDPRGGVRHVIPGKGNYLSDKATPHNWLSRTPHDGSLVHGLDDPLLPHLIDHLDQSERVEIAVAFVLESGVRRLAEHFRDLLARGGCLRLLTGDYMDVTDPNALLRLLDLQGNVELRVFESKGTSFHPKSFIFYDERGSGIAYVGSSNLTETALLTGVEWNYRVVSSDQQKSFREVKAAFERLFYHQQTKPLDARWVEEYRDRRKVLKSVSKPVDVPEEIPLTAPEPHEIQREALAALQQTREQGNSAGLVVLATGLGKTWLAAFDSNSPEYEKILFVAHREEILSQALQTFRRIRPEAALGLYTGRERTPEAEIMFASIQTLGREGHLRTFPQDAFDYIVVDEFHHAAAATYRRLINYFKPRFLLALTATPERTDGGDLLALCQENLVYRCDLIDGITRGLLSPFHYYGVPDEVDYSNIPWRSSRFDEEALTKAVATQSRAQNALKQYRARAGERTIGFCCSQRHADFMADYFQKQGLRAVAVHSGERSAPRATSLEQLQTGKLDIIFAVDIFNEGLDLPQIDTVMMLRPTESRILWLQQFGRGLRKLPGKTLKVIDYIGNHRAFLIKPRALFSLGSADVDVVSFIEAFQARTLGLPPGCEVTYDLQAIDILRGLLRVRPDPLKAFYEDFQHSTGIRPRAAEAFHEGYNPRAARPAYGSWISFVKAMGGLSSGQESVLTEKNGEFLSTLETTPMTKSFKMLVLLAMLNDDALPGDIGIDELSSGFAELAGRTAKLKDEVGEALFDKKELRALIEDNPINAWAGGRGTGGSSFFAYRDGVFKTTFDVSVESRADLQELVREIVDWRLAEYLQRSPDPSVPFATAKVICRVSHTQGRPIIFIDRKKHPDLPTGWTEVMVNGKPYQANFAKVAVNVIREGDGEENALPSILRGWFGPDAGLPGTSHSVELERTESGYQLQPANSNKQAASLQLWRSYAREQIPALFGAQFNPAKWQTGFVSLPGNFILLVTLNKGELGASFQYQDRFLGPELFQWQSQNRTRREGQVGQDLIHHVERGIKVHLFVRREKRGIGGGGAPFIYCGEVSYVDSAGEQPMTIKWKLGSTLPGRYQYLLQ